MATVKLSKSEQLVFDAARQLERLGRLAMADDLSEMTGLSRRAVLNRGCTIRGKGHGSFLIARPTVAPPPPKRSRFAVPSLDDLDALDRAILAAAASLVDEDGCVSPVAVTRSVRGAHEGRVLRLRKWGFWAWPSPDPTRGSHADPEIALEVRAEAMERMLDARHQVDDPRVHGWLSVPRSTPPVPAGWHAPLSLPERPSPVRVYLAEWRRIRRSWRKAGAIARREVVAC